LAVGEVINMQTTDKVRIVQIAMATKVYESDVRPWKSSKPQVIPIPAGHEDSAEYVMRVLKHTVLPWNRRYCNSMYLRLEFRELTAPEQRRYNGAKITTLAPTRVCRVCQIGISADVMVCPHCGYDPDTVVGEDPENPFED